MKTLLLSLFLVTSAYAQGTTRTVVPYGLESQPGNVSDTPFLTPTERLQWFRSSYVAQTWTTEVLISGVSFRVNEVEGTAPAFRAEIPHLELWFSTTQHTAANLEHWEFSKGPDAQRVYAADSVILSAPGGEPVGPFGIHFQFDEAFRYDPAGGNLLMRLITGGQGTFERGGVIDAQSTGANPELAAMASFGYSDRPNPSNRGLVVEFTWSAIPEPIPAVILVPLLLAATIWKRRRHG